MGDRRALGITAWYSGVRYLSETVASLPVHSFRDVGGRRDPRANPLWLSRPDKEVPRLLLFECWMMSLLHRGNAYSFKLRDGVDRVTGLRVLHPDRVKPRQDRNTGLKIFDIRFADGSWVPYTSREILHIPGLGFDGVVGMNPIALHRESLGTVAAADEHAGRFFGQGTHLSGVVSIPKGLTDDQAKAYKARLDALHKGITKSHEIALLTHDAKYTPIGLSAEDAQLIESRTYGVLEVARILRIVPHKLYELSRATFSNIEHQSIESATDSIRPWAVRIEAFVNFDNDLMRGGNFIEFELEGLLRGDMKSRYDAYGVGIEKGFLTRNEPRRKENLPALPGLDEPLMPLNMVPVGAAAAEEETE